MKSTVKFSAEIMQYTQNALSTNAWIIVKYNANANPIKINVAIGQKGNVAYTFKRVSTSIAV